MTSSQIFFCNKCKKCYDMQISFYNGIHRIIITKYFEGFPHQPYFPEIECPIESDKIFNSKGTTGGCKKYTHTELIKLIKSHSARKYERDYNRKYAAVDYSFYFGK